MLKICKMDIELNYIDSDELEQNLNNTFIIDVRDVHEIYQTIPNAIIAPCSSFNTENIIKLIRESGKEKVVVYCMYSQERGPECAKKLIYAGLDNVYVLRFGYHGWTRRNDIDEELCYDDFMTYMFVDE